MKINSRPLQDQQEALCQQAQQFLQETVKDLPMFSIATRRDDLSELENHADRFRDSFEDVVLLGTGGSNLGAKTLCALQETQSPRLHFMDNVDPHTFSRLFKTLNPNKTGFIVISKSGNTAETLSQFLNCLQHWQKSLGQDKLPDHYLLISEPTDNKLRELGNHYKLPHLDHPTDIGGRFSCLSLVGLLPALIAGLDAAKVRSGAQKYLEACVEGTQLAPQQGAALAMSHEKTHPINVIMPYVDRLADFGMWYRQLWAESLGKEGRGITPVRAMGTVDQHSQLQLYLDGPKDKLFTVIELDTQGHGDTLTNTSIDYLEGHTLGDLLAAETKATLETLKSHECPTRHIVLDKLEEDTLGALFMHYMLETVLTAHLMGINAFDQPAVEQGKILTREFLAA